MTRSVPLWVGKTDDAAIPPRVRLRVFERFGGVCQLSRRKIMAGDAWQVDHIIALANGGTHSEDNLQPVLVDAHKAKTALDVKIKAKVARQKAKHLGIKSNKRSQLSPPPGTKFDWSRGRYVRNT